MTTAPQEVLGFNKFNPNCLRTAAQLQAANSHSEYSSVEDSTIYNLENGGERCFNSASLLLPNLALVSKEGKKKKEKKRERSFYDYLSFSFSSSRLYFFIYFFIHLFFFCFAGGCGHFDQPDACCVAAIG
jgi:hypothetical protein